MSKRSTFAAHDVHRIATGAMTAAAVCGALALAGCSTKEAPQSAAQTGAPAVAQAGAQAGAPSASRYDPATHTATVEARDFAFLAPDSVPAGWTTFHLVNNGSTLHHVQIVRLDSGKTLSDAVAALENPNAPPPRWVVFVGGPNAPNPGGTFDAMVNLTPGQYALLCLVDLPDHVPHFAKGMMHPFTVTAAIGAPSAAPTGDVTITASDYAFANSGALTAGHHMVEFLNKGPQPHEVEIARLAPGKTMKDFQAWFDNPAGPPPGDAIGGFTVEMPGATGYFSLDLTKGNYLLLCLIPAPDGKPHLAHGMVRPFTVE